MSFRADEASSKGFDQVRNYLIPRKFNVEERMQAEEALNRVRELCGPVVRAYPSWHPLVADHDDRNPSTIPGELCGYRGLDHTVYFAHGFITCPYHDGEDVIDSVRNITAAHCASIEVEELDVTLYNHGTKAILVRCDWTVPLEKDFLIPKSLAVPLMLEKELPSWRWAQLAETWETMRPYLLGDPHGNRSSLFVSQDTALALKKIYLSMVESGMYGPIKYV